MNLLCGHSELYSQTWPSSGTTRSGTAYALPTSAHPMPDSGSSSSHGRNLATPTASIAHGGRPQDSRGKRDLRLDLLHGRKTTRTSTLLPGIVETLLLPTPRATDGTKGGPNQRGSSGGLMLPSAVQMLLPTPTATPYGNNQSQSPGATVRPSLDGLASTGALTPPPSPAGSEF